MIIWLVAATAWAQDCDDWGEVTPASRTALPGETIKYSVDGLPVCGNKETCTWWVDGDVGLVEPEEGSPVFWTAPDEDDLPSQMSNCEKYTFQIHASCPDLNTASWGQITLQCSEFETRDSSVGGGGCYNPTTLGWLLFPLLAVGNLRRRYSAPD